MKKFIVFLCLCLLPWSIAAQVNKKMAIRIAESDARRNLHERMVGILVTSSYSKDQNEENLQYITRNASLMLEGIAIRFPNVSDKYIVAEAFVSKEKYLENIKKMAASPTKIYISELANLLPPQITARGFGPLTPDGAKILSAKRAAQIDAMTKIASQLFGETISSHSEVVDFILKHQEVKNKLASFQYLSGLEVLEEKTINTMVEVKVRMDLKFYNLYVKLVLEPFNPPGFKEFLSTLEESEITEDGVAIIQ